LITECVESALGELYAQVGGPESGAALAAVGSLSRRELGPRSDIDLVLLHDGKSWGKSSAKINKLANDLWYPLWDGRIRVDHSVRTPAECAEVAGRELSAGVGLLDLRVISGDAELAKGARTALLDSWRGNARKRLPELLASLDERLATFGDAAYLLEPDLKEARGGFRDVSMLRALAASWLTDRPHVGINEPYQRLLDVRDALHLASGRTLDRLIFSEIEAVATRLGYREPDDLRREVSLAARRIGHAVDLTVRAARQALPPRGVVLNFIKRERRPDYVKVDHGLIIHSEEVGLGPGTDAADPVVGLRAGALAAQRGLILSPVTADNLGKRGHALTTPWPEVAREALLEMLSAGPNVVPVWEDLDLAGCISRWIPCWEPIRARPQHNPVHQYTVDRHLVQTVAEAHAHLTRVDRPDILLLTCLFHDIGKLPGGGVHHADRGAPIAREAVQAIGLDQSDAELIEHLVRNHLTLAGLATKRDHADPATLDALVKAVQGRTDILHLLRSLTEADARAAGPAAWTPWRAQLINSLADNVEGLLVDRTTRVDVTQLVDVGLARSVRLDGRPRIRVETQPGGLQLIIAANDRLGLFSDTAGLFASHSVQVRSAVLHTVEGVAVNTWRIDKQLATDLPDTAYLIKQLSRLEAGEAGILAPVQRREARAHGSGAVSNPYVELVPDASETAAVIEVRTGDRAGLLYALGRSLSEIRLSIRSAHISTLAGQAIDTFYVTEVEGSAPSKQRVGEAVAALTKAAGIASPQATTASS
jgi:[protein-PII] uridylyltransferase